MPDQTISPAASATSCNSDTGSLIKTYAFQMPDDVERALADNAVASAAWRATPMADRLDCYGRLAMTFRNRSEPLAGCGAVGRHARKAVRRRQLARDGRQWGRRGPSAVQDRS